MPPLTCPSCQHINPDVATYCYFDGALLKGAQAGAVPQNRLAREFFFPSGRRCQTFDEFVQGCQEEWASARDMLQKGMFGQYFASLGRMDLVKANQEAQAAADPDIGLTTFLPSYYYEQFGVSKVQAGQLTMMAAFMGAAVRVFGGWISDRWGGVNALTLVLAVVAVALGLAGLASSSLVLTTLLLIVCFAALGAGNGALFQLVPLRWPASTAVAGSMIGEIGALGGGLVPNAMGLSKQYLGSYLWGFVFFALLSLVMLGVMRVMQVRWTRTWAEKGGRARMAADGVAAARA